MAAGPLSLHPALRPWYAAGLRHVYLDDEALAHMAEVRDAQIAQAKTPAVGYGTRPVAERNAAVDGASSYARRVPPRPQTNQPTRSESIPQPAQSAPNIPSAPNPQRMQEPQAPQGPQASGLPPEQWPKQWRDKLESTMATAKGAPVLWTYWALGEDLSGAPNGPRRDILRRIIGELNSARGTHCFWPIALPTETESAQNFGMAEENTTMKLEANAPIFLAGLHILAPRICVIMGSAALRTILPNSTAGPYQQAYYGRMLFLVLPDMDMLLKEPERVPAVVAYLRTQLQSFMARR